MKKLSKTETENKIKYFFEDIKNKSAEDVKKMKRLAMSQSISLKELKKKFCKKCLAPYSGKEKIRIKDKIKAVTCNKCGCISRWKIK